MASLRTSHKVAKLSSALATLRTGPNSLPLPSSIASLTLRETGLKGNNSARKFARATLPSLRFANPSVPISHAPAPPSTTTTTTPDATSNAWYQPPGLIINFHDQTRKAVFFPLPSSSKSDKLVEKFWETIKSEEGLRALKGVEEVEATTSAPVETKKVEEKVEEEKVGEKKKKQEQQEETLPGVGAV